MPEPNGDVDPDTGEVIDDERHPAMESPGCPAAETPDQEQQ